MRASKAAKRPSFHRLFAVLIRSSDQPSGNDDECTSEAIDNQLGLRRATTSIESPAPSARTGTATSALQSPPRDTTIRFVPDNLQDTAWLQKLRSG